MKFCVCNCDVAFNCGLLLIVESRFFVVIKIIAHFWYFVLIDLEELALRFNFFVGMPCCGAFEKITANCNVDFRAIEKKFGIDKTPADSINVLKKQFQLYWLCQCFR